MVENCILLQPPFFTRGWQNICKTFSNVLRSTQKLTTLKANKGRWAAQKPMYYDGHRPPCSANRNIITHWEHTVPLPRGRTVWAQLPNHHHPHLTRAGGRLTKVALVVCVLCAAEPKHLNAEMETWSRFESMFHLCCEQEVFTNLRKKNLWHGGVRLISVLLGDVLNLRT